MAEARVVKFCMHVGYFKSQHKDEKSHLKGWQTIAGPTLNFDAPNDTFGMLKARIVRFCVQVDYIIIKS